MQRAAMIFPVSRSPAKIMWRNELSVGAAFIRFLWNKARDSSFLIYFSTHFDHIFFAGVFLFSFRDHLEKKKQWKNTVKSGSSSKGY